MSDWIAKLKDQDDKASLAVQKENEFRLHRAAVIKGKIPAFWKSLVDCVESDCKTLNHTFSDDVSKQCSFSKQGDDQFTLTGNTKDRSILILKINIQSLEISETFHTGEDRTARRSSLGFNIDKNDELFLTGLSGNINLPRVAAESLIKRAIRAW